MDLSPDDIKHSFTNASTPLTHLASRKRKLETSLFPSSPKFSSTLNDDSLISNLKEICLESVPSTPEKQRSLLNASVISSPIEESRKILCSSIKYVKPIRERKFGTLKSRRICIGKHQRLLSSILHNNVIMQNVFRYLSDGDLYRFSLVSKPFYEALESNSAFFRYEIYKSNYKDNKENYVITPPGSPEKCDSPPRTDSENLNKFIRLGNRLNPNQSLTKCRKCNSAAIADNDIIQCQNVLSCGLIYCLRCPSSSETGAKDFKDSCGHATLRPTLGNMSNHMEDSFFFSSQDSGFYSENETPLKVKRNLFAATKSNSPKACLVVRNRSMDRVLVHQKDSLVYVPVVPNKAPVWRAVDEGSPPRRTCAVGSKQSKKNLKRLTR